MNVIEELNKFLDIAVKNRKYSINTAYAIRAALNLFGQELNEDELNSYEVFKDRFDSIYESISRKNGSKFTASSLQTYRSRMEKVMSDYEQYGTDVNKLASWNPPIRSKNLLAKVKKAPDVPDSNDSDNSDSGSSNKSVFDGLDKREISTKQNSKIYIMYPPDYTYEDADEIEAFGAYLKSRKKPSNG